MKRNAKSQGLPDRKEMHKAQNSPDQAQKTETPNLENLSRAELQRMSKSDIMALQRTAGNQAVSRLMARRQEEDELDYPGPRTQHREEDELDYPGPRSQRQGADPLAYPGPRSRRQGENPLAYPGPRTRKLRGNGVQPQAGSARGGGGAERAAPSSSATGNIGDATDLDGQALYGWDRTITASDVATVVNGVIPTESSEEEMPRIVIFSGTHGNTKGHLVNDATSRGFVAEDQATAAAVNAAYPGVQVEVIDVVNSYKTKAELTAIYGMTNFIRILGWCYSKRSYNLGNTIKSNWWKSPDSL